MSEKTLMVSVPEEILEQFQFYCAQQGCTPSYRVQQLIEKDMGGALEAAVEKRTSLRDAALQSEAAPDADPKMSKSSEKVPTIEELKLRRETAGE